MSGLFAGIYQPATRASHSVGQKSDHAFAHQDQSHAGEGQLVEGQRRDQVHNRYSLNVCKNVLQGNGAGK